MEKTGRVVFEKGRSGRGERYIHKRTATNEENRTANVTRKASGKASGKASSREASSTAELALFDPAANNTR